MRKLVEKVITKLTGFNLELNKFYFNARYEEVELMQLLGFAKIEGSYAMTPNQQTLKTHQGFIVLNRFNCEEVYGYSEIKEYINGEVTIVKGDTTENFPMVNLYVYTGFYSADLPPEIKSVLTSFAKK
jgi:hypothetical protein